MEHRTSRTAAIIAVGLWLTAFDALAWGPRAHEVIATTALQVIRRTYPQAFKTEQSSYDLDIVRGAIDGPDVLRESLSLNTDPEAVAALGKEMQLLREARKFGAGSYLAYRMGALSALAADLILPYSLETTPSTAGIRKRVEMDIDAHISGYRFHPDKASRKRVRNAREYLDKLRPFHADGRKMIALDYTHGDGYGGYLQQAGPVYFRDAVETVADVWFTVLRPEKDASDTVPSARAMTGYLVEEIGYLLAVKKNRIEAEKVYSSFASVNPGLPDTYEKVGDLFYAFGDEERGIQEWKTAVGFAWSERKRVTKKLAHHYLKFGKTCLEKAAAPRPEERDLPNALDAFTQCLEYDRENVEAGALLRKTRAAIADREERRELAIRIVSSASKLVKQAEADENEQAWANAISGYGRASLLFETVEEEFADQYKASQKGMDQCKKQVSRIVDTLLTKAAEAIDTGDLCLKENKYDEAIGLYQSIESMVNVIPGDESTTVSKQRKEMVASAKEKVEAALVAKKRYEQEQRDRQPQMPQTAEAGG